MALRDPLSLLDPELALDHSSSSFDVDEPPDTVAKLDQNEAARDLPPPWRARLLELLEHTPWNRYPQPVAYAGIKARFAEALGQPPERVVLTVGCDQVILASFQAVGGPGRRARIFEPTYPVYRHFARLTRTGLTAIPLGADGEVTVERLSGGAEAPSDHLLCLVSPNNPTGRPVAREVVERALGLEPARAVLVDEAYVDFADPSASVVALLDDHPNLIIGRSLSKSLVAGLRLGYALAAPELVTILERLLFAPYHLNHLQLALARCAGEPGLIDELRHRCAAVVEQRRALALGLAELGLRVWPSAANFILFAPGPSHPPGPELQRMLLERGVRIRGAAAFAGLRDELRVTVGSRSENESFLAALRACLRFLVPASPLA